MGQSSRMPDCFNTIRLIAALQVLYVHTVIHLGLSMPEFVSAILGFFKGVPIFFTFSGFLIWFSIGRSATLGQYLKKRFWRIYPELWCAVMVEVIVLACLIDFPMEWGKFFLFMGGQGSCLQFWTPDFLRSYGCGVPNGALWTICVLIQWYLFAYFAYKLLHGKGLARWLVAIAAAIVLGVTSGWAKSEALVFKIYENTFLPYSWMFLIAAFVAEHVEIVRPIAIRWRYFIVALTILLMVTGCDLTALRYGVGNTLLLFLACLGIGYAFPAVNIRTDISYGIYIYHMTVVNAFIAFGIGKYSGWEAFVVLGMVIAVTCMFAWLSTRFIGSGRSWGKRKA